MPMRAPLIAEPDEADEGGRPMRGRSLSDIGPLHDLGLAHSRTARRCTTVWDAENAGQGRMLSRRSSTVNSEPFRDEDEREFSDRIRVRWFVKYFDKTVLNYDAEGIAGPGVFAAAATSASIFGKWELVRDVLLLWLLAAVVAAIVYATGAHITDAEAGRLKDLVTDFHTLCTFLLGFFVSTSLNRWWAIRNDCIGALWGMIDDLSLIVGTYFPADTMADREVRERVLRWGVLSHELVYKQARAEEDLSDLISRGLLLERELELLSRLASKPQVVWAWMCSYLAHLAYGDPKQGGGRLPYPVTVLPQLHEICRKARGAIGAAFAYTDTQVPFRYVHVLCLIIWVHNLFQAVNSGFVIAVTLERHEGMRMIVELVFLVFYPLVYLGLLHLGVEMLNPLRSRKDVDFPRGAWSYYMIAENRSLLGGNAQPNGPPWGMPASWKGGAGGTLSAS